MSYVIAAPEMMTAAATDLANIGSTLSEANAAAAAPTTAVVAAAEDEVSAAIASLFSSHGQQFQALSAQAAAFHDQFVQTLNEAGGTYAATEAANASPLADVVQGAQSLAVFSPVKDLTGRPLIGNGANGAPGTGQAGAPGGWLLGDGGAGGSGAPGTGGAGGAGGNAGAHCWATAGRRGGIEHGARRGRRGRRTRRQWGPAPSAPVGPAGPAGCSAGCWVRAVGTAAPAESAMLASGAPAGPAATPAPAGDAPARPGPAATAGCYSAHPGITG